jgi:hypothetical protein
MKYRNLGIVLSGMLATAGSLTSVSEASAEGEFHGPRAPAAPNNPQAVADAQGRVTFSWNDQSNNELGFRLVRDRQITANTWGEGSGATVGANVTSYSETLSPVSTATACGPTTRRATRRTRRTCR